MSDPTEWDFDYAPISAGPVDDGSAECDLVLATSDDIDPALIAEVLSTTIGHVEVVPLFAAHPVFWTRITASTPVHRRELSHALLSRGIGVRYVVSSTRGSQQLAPRLAVERAQPRKAGNWKVRNPTTGAEPRLPWRWFLRENGVDVDRSACGTGAGTRLAVIDNDGRDVDKVGLDAEILVGIETIPRAGAHAGLMFGWAVGARSNDGSHFRGVAPDASPRLYCIPKGNDEIISLPLAIVRAVEDGADVIVCATYVEGQTSALLDDALEFASTLGRSGRGTLVVMPTGREMSSPADSLHSSLSLGLGDPASDPRVFCVGPSARNRGWFLWRDRHGKMRPFANRGPALRWLAPGDDLAYPFASDDRPAHAESSGASAVAAGVLLLVLGTNPTLELRELDQLILSTTSEVEESSILPTELGDPADVLPKGRDPDGHNAKHGYGRLNAVAACLAASDIVPAALIHVGELDAARRYAALLPSRLYSHELAAWAARVFLQDPLLRHEACSIARATRLYARHPERAAIQHAGHLLRHLSLVLRLLARAKPSPDVAAELALLEERLQTHFPANSAEARALELKLVSFVASLNVEEVDGRSLEESSGVPSRIRTRVIGVVPSARENARR